VAPPSDPAEDFLRAGVGAGEAARHCRGVRRAVVENKVVTGRLVRLACERHLRDLVDGPARGLRWDRETAQRAIDFFPAVLASQQGAIRGPAVQPARMGTIRRWLDLRLEAAAAGQEDRGQALPARRSCPPRGKNGKSTMRQARPQGADRRRRAWRGNLLGRDDARSGPDRVHRSGAHAGGLAGAAPADVKTTNNLAVLPTASWSGRSRPTRRPWTA